MKAKRKIEIFSAGCAVCEETVKEVKAAACPDCEVVVYDLNSVSATDGGKEKAKQYGIKSVPAVVIDGQTAGCCSGRGVDINELKQAGLGQALET